MNVLVMYDIKNNKDRTKFSKSLESFGLERIQKSIFVGYIQKKYLPLIQISDDIIILKLNKKQLSKIKLKVKDYESTFNTKNVIFI